MGIPNQTNHYTFSDSDRTTSHSKQRANPIGDIIECQQVLKKIITTPCYQLDGKGEVLPVPAREIASCSVALAKLEAQKRAMQGKANPAPEKRSERPKPPKPQSTYEEPASVSNVVPLDQQPGVTQSAKP